MSNLNDVKFLIEESDQYLEDIKANGLSLEEAPSTFSCITDMLNEAQLLLKEMADETVQQAD